MKILIVFFSTVLFGCNSFTEHTKLQVDESMKKAKQEMDDEVNKNKKDFTLSYQNALEKNKDSLDQKNINEFRGSLIKTENYMDSLNREMNKLDENDVNNVSVVKEIFLNKGHGDSILISIKNAIAVAQGITRNTSGATKIKATSDSLISESSPGKWTQQLFGLTNPLGASMILYGLQTELYKIGNLTLQTY